MARRFAIRLADLNIEVATLHDRAHLLCSDYLQQDRGKADFAVSTDQEGIDYERAQDALGGFDDAYYETLAVYRRIAEELPLHGRLLVHGSAVAIGQRAWLFMAPSGTGKSTHARWWRTVFADEQPYMVNDDKPILGMREDGFVAYGTPWDGKERLSSNVCVPLAAIGVVERGEADRVEAIPASRGISAIMPHVYRPTGSAAMLATIDVLRALSEKVPLFKVVATNTANAARVSRSAMD